LDDKHAHNDQTLSPVDENRMNRSVLCATGFRAPRAGVESTAPVLEGGCRMTLSMLLYALMVCSLLAVTGLLVFDGAWRRMKRPRPVPVRPCVSERTRITWL